MKNLSAYIGVLIGLIAISPSAITTIDILLCFFTDTTIINWTDGKCFFAFFWTLVIAPYGMALLIEALDDILICDIFWEMEASFLNIVDNFKMFCHFLLTLFYLFVHINPPAP